jgi:methylated-DNA-protein-cysteine methyltransferase-like protein
VSDPTGTLNLADPLDRKRAVLAVVSAIPRGEVRSYAEVARAAGWPRHARLVARVLSESEVPGLPWHRVLRADGRIAFPKGSPSWLEQARRLAIEGLTLIEGRVRRAGRQAGGDSGLDAALWGASPQPRGGAKARARRSSDSRRG